MNFELSSSTPLAQQRRGGGHRKKPNLWACITLSLGFLPRTEPEGPLLLHQTGTLWPLAVEGSFIIQSFVVTTSCWVLNVASSAPAP